MTFFDIERFLKNKIKFIFKEFGNLSTLSTYVFCHGSIPAHGNKNTQQTHRKDACIK